MAELKIIPTTTEVNIDILNKIKIYTYYNSEGLPNTLKAFFAEEAGTSGGVSYKEGDLVIIMKNHPGKIDYILDEDTGDLIVIADDAANYSLDEDTGDLIYTIP